MLLLSPFLHFLSRVLCAQSPFVPLSVKLLTRSTGAHLGLVVQLLELLVFEGEGGRRGGVLHQTELLFISLALTPLC